MLPFPVIDNDELAKILHINADGDLPGFAPAKVSGLYDVDGGGAALRGAARRDLRRGLRGDRATGARFVVLSDRDSDADRAPIPSLLLTSAVHHHLVREKTRTQVGLIVEAGDVREVHHVALLIGYGAAAVNPYLAMETVEDLVRRGVVTDVAPEKAVRNLVKALGKGVLKVMSKMGISTVASYRGAQVFEAVGLVAGRRRRLLHRHHVASSAASASTSSPRRSRAGTPSPTRRPASRRRTAALDVGGEYQWRREGEPHLFDPETVFRLQHATRAGRYDIFKQYTARVDEQSERLMTLRGLFRFKDGVRPPVPLDEVEPVERDRQAVLHRRDVVRLDLAARRTRRSRSR